MGIFKKNMANKDATQPLEETTPEEVKVPEVQTEEVEDRRHYNCFPCKGEGLVFNDNTKQHEKCSECNGTGKVGQ